MSNSLKVLLVLTGLVSLVGYAGSRVVACLWSHRLPTVTELLISTVLAFATYIITTSRD